MLSLENLLATFRQHGATRLFAKRLSPNDNSKNQIYLGGDFSALGLIPHGPVVTDDAELAGSVRDRAKAPLRFCWHTEDGFQRAPHAQLILYPKYPEVRLSGLLKGCRGAPGDVLRVRDEGRVLVLGARPDGVVFGFAAASGHPVAQEINAMALPETLGVFILLSAYGTAAPDTRGALIAKLRQIHLEGWIPSQKLGVDGVGRPYAARNGGGYTLEARLGVTPNGYAEPDYLGWEVKQYGVANLAKPVAKSPVTLMTPEPSGGFYRTDGPAAFVRRFGYADKSGKADRINFGGIYVAGRAAHGDTGLRFDIAGYNASTGKIEDMGGALALVTADGEAAAAWSFASLIDHWNRKHARAVYVPSVRRDAPPAYAYGAAVTLCENTDFLKFVQAAAAGAVYLDPALKLEKAGSAKPVLKCRNQFRIRQPAVAQLYEKCGITDVTAE